MQKHCEATLPLQDARGLQGVPGEDQLQAKHPNPHSGGTLLYTYYVLLFVTEKSATKSENWDFLLERPRVSTFQATSRIWGLRGRKCDAEAFSCPQLGRICRCFFNKIC